MKRLLPVILLTFVNTIGFSILIPVLPFIADQYGGGALMYGILLSSYALFQFLATPLLGSLSDKYGRRPILLISQFGTFLSWIVFGLAYFLPDVEFLGYALPVVVIAFSRVLDGITGGNVSVTSAYLSDITTPAERTEKFAILGATMGFGFLIGPALGGVSASFSIGYLGTVIVASLISLVTLIIMFTNLKESLSEENRSHDLEIHILTEINLYKKIKQFSHRKSTRHLFIHKVFLTLTFAAFTATFTLYAKDTLLLNEKNLGILLLVIGCFSIFNQLVVIRRLARRFSNKFVFNLGQFIIALSLGLLMLEPTLIYFTLIMYLTNLGIGMTMATFKSMLTGSVPAHQQGQITGIDEAIMAGSNGVTPIIATAIYGLLYHLSFGIFALFILIPYFIIDLPIFLKRKKIV